MQPSVCKRNCWIAGAVIGLIVLLFGLPGMGAAAAVVVGVVAALFAGGLLQWLLCSGHSEDSAGDRDRNEAIEGRDIGMDRHADPGPEGTVITGSGSEERTVAPLGRLAPPSGIIAGAARTMSEGAVLASARNGQAPTFGNVPAADLAQQSAGAAPLAEPAPLAQDSPLEDTRSVMAVPSQSEHHDMPGEAVPVAEPGGAQDELPPNGPSERLAAQRDDDAGHSARLRGGKIRVTGGEGGGSGSGGGNIDAGSSGGNAV